MAAHTLSLFTGQGGLDLGLDIAINGHRIVCCVEWDSFSAATVVARMEEQGMGSPPIWDDITTFDGKPWRGKVDIVSAGFPCQPFSVAGKDKGTEDERWLWEDIERVLGEVQPGWVFLENVPGLVRHGLGSVLSGLARLGYDARWDVFSAGELGAPHQRQRFFLLGRRRNTSKRLAYSSGEGSQGDEFRKALSVLQGPVSGSNSPHVAASKLCKTQLGYFPPRPYEDVWEEVLRVTPEIEPSVCREIDGSADTL